MIANSEEFLLVLIPVVMGFTLLILFVFVYIK